MNAFAALFLAFPFYLAVKGRLAAVVAFAKPGNVKANNAAPSGQAVASTSAQPASVDQSTADIQQPANSAASYLSAAESVMSMLS